MGADLNRMKQSLTWNFDYITMQNDIILADVINYYPEIINELEPMATGKISVFKKQYRKEKSAGIFTSKRR